ncbi:hypothetical protein L9F63_021261, partial [Diploptera punctata]
LVEVSRLMIGARGVGGATSHGRLVVCYVSTWAVYRPDKGAWSIDNLDPTLCTHVVYAFAGLDNNTNTIRSLNPYYDLEDNWGKGTFRKFTALKNRHPHLKVSLAIGGWNEGSANYSRMASTPENRRNFIASVTGFLTKYNFDGLDLDWEYPTQRGGDPSDKQNFVLLAKELREEFDKHGWLLTAALGVGDDVVDKAYDLKSLAKYLDYMHAMCYDLHGTWDRKVGHNAPLKSKNHKDTRTVEHALRHFLKMGAPARKLVMGVPMYGRTFILEDPDSTTIIGAPAKEQGFAGPFTREVGFMGYNEICLNLSSGGWKQFWDEESLTPYAVQNEKVFSYDDERSIAEKVKFAMELNLAGIMVWSIDTDDFHGSCVSSNGSVSTNYPLMKTISTTITEVLKERQESGDVQKDHNETDKQDEQNEIDGSGSEVINKFSSNAEKYRTAF